MPISYTTRIEEWRADRDESLRRENSWLALAGLFWLKPGVNRVGSHKDCDVVLPHSAPAHLGDIMFEYGALRYRPAHGELALINGMAADHTELHTDRHENPSLITRDELSLLVIERADRLAVRVWDNARLERRSFPPRLWFGIDESYCLPARYTPYHEPKPVIITDVLGLTHEDHIQGYVSFVLHNHVLKLDAMKFGHELLIRFKDLTSGKETYPAGRVLDAEMTDEENAILDFNLACSPPCAFTDFATCPLPHADNHLTVRVAAGEKYRKHK
jgi:uncharacterized protein (DUF1684 family)